METGLVLVSGRRDPIDYGSEKTGQAREVVWPRHRQGHGEHGPVQSRAASCDLIDRSHDRVWVVRRGKYLPSFANYLTDFA